MTKLLSEQELRDEFSKISFGRNKTDPNKCVLIPVDELLHLIHSQKLAHANMVIGKNETDLMMRPPMLFNEENSDAWDAYLKAAMRDLLRVEQRERNK